jgi:pimeloyl-ACP methyl ester carboxylesterase
MDQAPETSETDNGTNLSGPHRYRRLSIVVQDGLTLRGRHYPAPSSSDHRRPVLCLAGLTRNGRDFTRLAETLSSGPAARDVYTLDMRGRGLSDFAKDWKTYTIQTELNDVIDAMTALGLFDVALIGTSRGGLIAMALGAVQPGRIGVLVLNDIGPVIEVDGLTRIGAYVGATPAPQSWADAADIVKRGNQRHFPDVSDDEWLVFARQWFNERDGKPVLGYDLDISKTFQLPKDGLPELWPQFEAVTRVPCLTVRGANSDLLSADTVAEMARRHHRFESHVVPGQGHAPLLRDAETLTRISDFIASHDA